MPLFLPGKSHGQKSLTGYSPWGHKESNTTKQLDTLRTGTRAGTPNPAQALLPHCPTITRVSAHAPLLGRQPWQPHLSTSSFQSVSLSLWKESGP